MPVPSCSYRVKIHDSSSRWLKHLVLKHYFYAASLQNVLLCNLEEMRASTEMIDPQKVYVDTNVYAMDGFKRLGLYQRLKSVSQTGRPIHNTLLRSLTGEKSTACKQHCQMSAQGLAPQAKRFLERVNIPLPELCICLPPPNQL
jgi:hypothetical protein